jgi:hypothetical protein
MDPEIQPKNLDPLIEILKDLAGKTFSFGLSLNTTDPNRLEACPKPAQSKSE